MAPQQRAPRRVVRRGQFLAQQPGMPGGQRHEADPAPGADGARGRRNDQCEPAADAQRAIQGADVDDHCFLLDTIRRKSTRTG
jgi:hypothetical protein